MTALKLIEVGGSLGVSLPKEALVKLGVHEGGTLFLSETPEGLQLSVSDPDHEAKMAVARRIMRERHNVLRELAK